MNVMIRRSIGLSQRSSNAWKAAGGWFPRRERNTRACLSLAIGKGEGTNPIINLGDTTFDPSQNDLTTYGITGTLYNRGSNIRCLIQPGRTRERLSEFMPNDPRNGVHQGLLDFWVKAPGQGGQGKTRMLRWYNELPQIPEAWDMQTHVDGQEYRVITVNLKVVQVSKRFGDDDHRRYEWIGVTAAPASVKEIAREGARRIDGATIIGWDIIRNDAFTYILEGNSSPGVNVSTAQRIIKEITSVSHD